MAFADSDEFAWRHYMDVHGAVHASSATMAELMAILVAMSMMVGPLCGAEHVELPFLPDLEQCTDMLLAALT